MKKIPTEDCDRQRKGRVDARSDSLRQRFGRCCHNDALGRFTSSATSGFIMRRNGRNSFEFEKGRVSIIAERWTMIRCKSENHVPIVAVSEEPRVLHDPSPASCDRLLFPGVQVSGVWSHKVPARPQLVEEGLSGEFPDSHSVVVDQPVAETVEKTLDDMRVISPKKSQPIFLFIEERSKKPNNSKQTGRHDVFHKNFPKIRMVKSVSSRITTQGPCKEPPGSERRPCSSCRKHF